MLHPSSSQYLSQQHHESWVSASKGHRASIRAHCCSIASCRTIWVGPWLHRHPGPWLHKVGETLGEDFPLTVGVATGEFADSQDKLNTAARAGGITQGPAIVTMDRR